MGKIRVKTLGSEEEQEEKKKAKERAEQKRIEAMKAKAAEEKKAEAAATPEKQAAEKPVDEEPEKKKSKQETKKSKGATGKSVKKHSNNYLSVAATVDKNNKYSLDEAISLLIKLQRAKFDETVELHINTTDKGISGQVTLPHGTGKEVKIEIANQGEDPKHVEELVKNIEAGKMNFDVLIATPDTMPKLARVARILGPRGLMPNPKSGTVTPKPEEVAKKFQGGQVNFKTEAKFPLLHLAVGKVSFGEKKIAENVKTAITAIQLKNIKTTTIKSTMSPGIKVDTSSL